MDKATVIEQALDLLGQHAYIANSGTESVVDKQYNHVLRECVSSHHWSFARRKVTLTCEKDGTFTLPLDCLRIKSVNRADSTAPYLERLDFWQLYDRTIEAPEQQQLILVYTEDYTATGRDLPDSAPHFCQYAIHTLASRIAPTICGAAGIELAQMLLQRATEYKSAALIHDRQQDNSNDQLTKEAALNSMRKFRFHY